MDWMRGVKKGRGMEAAAAVWSLRPWRDGAARGWVGKAEGGVGVGTVEIRSLILALPSVIWCDDAL